MSTNPIDVIKDFMQNTAPDKVEAAARRLVADEATYISLNFENPELKRILPWTEGKGVKVKGSKVKGSSLPLTHIDLTSMI